MFPTIEDFIFNEVIRGSVDYISGEESGWIYKNATGYFTTIKDFEPNMYDHFKKAVTKSKLKLNPEMQNILLRLLEPHWSSDQCGDGEYRTELYRHFKGFGGGGICPVITESTFSLPQSVIHHVKREVVPSLSKPLLRDIRCIGSLMRLYIEKDLEYIKGHYHW